MRLNTEYLWDNYRKLQNEYNTLIEDAKIKYDLNLRNYLWNNKENLNSKKWWHIAKSLLGQNKKSNIPPLIIGDNNEKIISDDKIFF